MGFEKTVHVWCRNGLCTLILGILLSLVTLGQSVPTVMNYQGRLTDNTPSQVAINTTVAIDFEIYDDPVAGSQLWMESWASVSVVDGIFSVMLGSNGAALPASVFSGGTVRYLQLTVDGEILSPRQRIGSVGFASQGENAALAADLDCTTCVAEGELDFDPATQAELDSHGGSDDHALTYVNVGGDAMTGTLALAGDPIANLDAATKQYVDGLAGGSETDPEVNMTATNAVPRWDGAALVDGSVVDDGSGIVVDGAATVKGDLQVNGNTTIGDDGADTLTIGGVTMVSQINGVIVVDGVNFATIQEAINALPVSGGKVFIPSGVYTEDNITINKNNVSLEGAGRSTIVESSSSANPVFRSSGFSGVSIKNVTIRYTAYVADLDRVGVLIQAGGGGYSDLIIQGCFFENTYAGVWVYGNSTNIGSRIRIQNNIFDTFYYAVNLDGTTSTAEYLSRVTVKDNIMDSTLASSRGIYNRYAKQSVFEGNLIHTNLGFGIMNSYGYHNVISDNSIDSSTTCISNATGSYAIISGNTLRSPSTNGILNTGIGTTMTGNQIYNSGGYGIRNTVSNCTIAANNITSSASDGIRNEGNADYSTINGNTIYDPAGYGIYNQGSGNTVVSNSIYSPGNSTQHGIFNSGTNSTISANSVFDPIAEGIYNQGSSTTVASNSIYSPGDMGIYSSGIATGINGNTIDTAGNSAAEYAIYANAVSTSVSGNVVYQTGTGSSGAIYLGTSADYATVSANAIFGAVGFGIDANGTNTSIGNNAIYAPSGNGIDASANNAVAVGNTIRQAGGVGILLAGADSAAVGNAIELPGSYGIRTSGVNSVAAGNTVDDPSNYGIYNSSTGGSVAANTIFSGSSDGIYNSGTYVSMSANFVSGANNEGIDNNSSYTVMSANTIIGAGGDGINSSGSNAVLASNVIEVAGSDGIQSIGGYVSISNNSISNVTTNGVNNSGEHVVVSSNTILTPGIEGIYNLGDHGAITSNAIDNPGSNGVYNSGSQTIVVANNLDRASTNAIFNDDTASADRVILGLNLGSTMGSGGINSGGDYSVAIGNLMYNPVLQSYTFDNSDYGLMIGNYANDTIGVLDSGIFFGNGSIYNNVTGNYTYGHYRGLTVSSDSYRFIISSNYAYNAENSGIRYATTTGEGTISGNFIYSAASSSSSSSLYVVAPRMTIIGNTISGGGAAGIRAIGGRVGIIGNVSTNNTGDEIDVNSTSENIILGNTTFTGTIAGDDADDDVAHNQDDNS